MPTYVALELLVPVARTVQVYEETAHNRHTSNIIITPGLTLTRQTS